MGVRMRRVNSTKGGFVPLSFLQTTFDKYVIAKENYEGGDFELSFNENDIIEVLKEDKDMDETGEGYSFGKLVVSDFLNRSGDSVFGLNSSGPDGFVVTGLFPTDLTFEFNLDDDGE